MPLKPGRVRCSTWFDEGSDTLIGLDAICKKMGTTRGEVIRYIVIDWIEKSKGSLPLPSAPIPTPETKQQTVKNKSPKSPMIRENKAALDALDLD